MGLYKLQGRSRCFIHADELMKDKVDQDSQVVFHTEAQSVLQAYCSGELSEKENAFNKLNCQQNSHSGSLPTVKIKGNEEADKLAKKGSQNKQTVSDRECKTIIKSIFRHTKKPNYSYHILPRKQQVIIFRLRTGHNRLNSHMYRVMKVPSPLCPCGEADQNAAHILQDCVLYEQLRKDICMESTSLWEKLHGPVEQLYRTTRFLTYTGLWV